MVTPGLQGLPLARAISTAAHSIHTITTQWPGIAPPQNAQVRTKFVACMCSSAADALLARWPTTAHPVTPACPQQTAHINVTLKGHQHCSYS
jgi:hypothetical protein